MKKFLKIFIPIIAVVLIALAALFFWLNKGGNNNGDAAYVMSVKDINYASGSYSVDRFSAIIESQQTVDFKKNNNRDILEVVVKEGDNVQNGDVLFRYDVRSSENSIAEANLEIEGLNSELAIYRQNNTTENQILARQTEIAIQKKQVEIASYQQEIANAEVVSTLAGVVKEVNEDGVGLDGAEAPIVKVMEKGDFRVKGKVDEQLISLITVGDPVIVRSRIDENKTWTGKITKIETEPQSNEDNNNYFYDGGSSEKASSYPFYVALDNNEGLMLGQHVFVEPDNGTEVNLSGIWLMSDYIIQDGDRYYVYVAENNKLVKREIRVGIINEELYITEITNGLDENDLIAWPDDSYTEGMPAINLSEERE